MVLKVLRKVNDVFDTISYWVLAIMMGAMLLVAFGQVVGRNIIHIVPSWMEEICRYFLIWTSYLGAASLLRKGGHTCVSVLVNIFPYKVRQYIAVIVDLIMTVFYGILGYYGVLLTIRYAYRMAETMPFSLAWVYLVFPVTFILMALYSVEEIITLFVDPDKVGRIQSDRIDDVDMILEAEEKAKQLQGKEENQPQSLEEEGT